MRSYTERCRRGRPSDTAELSEASRVSGFPIPVKRGGATPIKHCIYIIKENRTYDQVFGDIAEGNGDSKLCLFPEKITPNLHSLVKQFVLLDNFYADGSAARYDHRGRAAG